MSDMLIDKREKPIRDKAHLKFVASQVCCCCGQSPVQSHHLIGDYSSMGVPARQGMKRGDNYAIPCCGSCHDRLHNAGDEIAFLSKYCVDGLALAKKLWNENEMSLKGEIDEQD